MTEERTEERKSVGRVLRSVAIWVLVIVIAVAAGFGVGYFLRYKDFQELQQLLADQRAEMRAQITSLEKQLLEAQKSQLEQALARAKLRAGMDQVLESVTAALAEVEQKNFGRARLKIEAARAALNAAVGVTLSVREAVGDRLEEITGDLEQLDIKARERIATLAQDLEKGRVPGQASN